jgi:DNA-binding winged helix-turn-helix (wHTH) protein/predicted ATPase
MPDLIYRFGPFRLDVRERRLVRGGETVPIRGKVFDTLRVLVENHNRLMIKDELMKAVWPDSVVEENNLDHNVSVIRKALGEQRGGVKYIETVPRQGYRFVQAIEVSAAPPFLAVPAREHLADSSPDSGLVEREKELSQLRAAFEQAGSGSRQLIFVTGEAGIGKTALVRAFANRIAGVPSTYVVRGDCQNHYGEGEPYMPVLEALSRLARGDGGSCIKVLEQYAPSWLAQLPSIAESNRAMPDQPGRLGITAERMLREMAEAIELLTAEQTLVLILEDLHWADYSTIDLLARFAQRTEPARLLFIGTYRPSDAKARSHPIYATAQRLKLQPCCREIPLAPLTVDGFAQYLQNRFGDALPAVAAQRLHARTQGNPLFLVTVVNSWLLNGSLANGSAPNADAASSPPGDMEDLSFAVPDDLRQLIEQQITELDSSDQEVIEAASVAGSRFCPAAIARALDRSSSEVEARCAALAEDGRFLVAAGAQEWPDCTVSESYLFLHSVHRDVVYERIPAGRKVRLHDQIASRLEEGYRGHEDDIAAELAVHFREARHAPRALKYLQRAAAQSLIRSAHREAIAHLKSALEMLRRLPEMSERARWERDLLALLAPALVITRGFADPEAEHAFRRAYELSTQLDGPSVNFPVVFGLAVMLEIRGQYPKAQQLMERHLAGQERCGGFLLEARDLLACSRFHQGSFKDALEHGEEGARAYSPDHHSIISAALGEDPGIDCHTWAALSLWFLGYPDRALTAGRLAVSLARDPSRLYSLANAQSQLAMLHQLRQEPAATLEWANQTITLASQQGYPSRRAAAQVLRGWALTRLGEVQDGTRVIQEGMNGCAAAGAELDRPYHLALLAEAHLIAGRPAEAAAVLDLALAHTSDTPNFFYAAELYRLRGVAAGSLTLSRPEASRAAGHWICRALEVTALQGALSLELRSSLSLAELCNQTAQADSARERMAKVHARFTEGFETPDLRKAADFLRSIPLEPAISAR